MESVKVNLFSHFSVTPANIVLSIGQLTLRNLRLKKGALDKFRLPVDVLEGQYTTCFLILVKIESPGHLGTFTLSLYWMNLGNRPVEILIEDVYLLVVPSPQVNIDPEEEDRRAQAAKQERLESAELLHMRGPAEVPPSVYSLSLTSIVVHMLNLS